MRVHLNHVHVHTRPVFASAYRYYVVVDSPIEAWKTQNYPHADGVIGGRYDIGTNYNTNKLDTLTFFSQNQSIYPPR